MLAIAVGAIGVAYWRSGVSQRGARPAPPPAARPGNYIGSNSCAECHEEIAEKYASHPMARALFPIEKEPDQGQYKDKVEFDIDGGMRYRVTRETDQRVHHVLGLSTEGEPVYDQSVNIRFAIGSGARGRSYVHERGGRLFMSPISWYSTKPKWDLSPGYNKNNQQFNRPAIDRCLFCHSGRLNEPLEADGPTNHPRYKSPVFLEHGIGCERCHGPGEQHVEFHRQNKSTVKDSIVNPASLAPSRREAVCNQCHLTGEMQFARFGRRNRDFRPGDHLGDIWSILVEGSRIADGKRTIAVSHVEQMHESRCFQASSGKLGCISCHDPHSIPAEETKASVYKERCVSCHQDRGCSLPEPQQQAEPNRGSCIACHMPRLEASDVPHTTQTDHRVLRDPKRPESARPVESPPSANLTDSKFLEGLRIFDLEEAPLSDTERDRVVGLVLAKKAGFSQEPAVTARAVELLTRVSKELPEDLESLDHLALLMLVQERANEAKEIWTRVLALSPRHATARYSLARIAQSQQRFEDAEAHLRKLVEFEPWNSRWHGQLASQFAQLGRPTKALPFAFKSLELNPSDLTAYELVIDVLRGAGEDERAREFVQKLEKLRHPPKAIPSSLP